MTITALPHSWVVAAVAIIVAAVVANTYRLSAAVDREHAARVECELEVSKLSAAIDRQNKTVQAWREISAAAADRARAAETAAEKLEADRRKVLADLESWKRKPGEAECAAAKRLLLEYQR